MRECVFFFCKKGRANTRGEVRTEADTKRPQRKARGMEAVDAKLAEESEKQEKRCRRETEVREMQSRQALSWRHRSWLMEWELVWQSKAGCHVTEGEQETREQGLGGAHKQEVCACVRACLRVCTSLFFSWCVELSVRMRLRTGHLLPEERTFEGKWNGRGLRYRLRCTPGVSKKFGYKSVTHNPQVTFDTAMPCQQKVLFKGVTALRVLFSVHVILVKRREKLIWSPAFCLPLILAEEPIWLLKRKYASAFYELRLKAKQRRTALLSLLPNASFTVLVAFTLHLHHSAQWQVSNDKKIYPSLRKLSSLSDGCAKL